VRNVRINEPKKERKLLIQDIFRVIYSPLKAFERLAEAPTVKGPLIILLLTLLASISAQYVSSSKTLLQTEQNGKYVPLTATDMFNQQLILNLRDSVFIFFVKWLIYGSAFLLVLKLFRAKEGPWHQVFIVIAYSFIIAAVFIFINAIVFVTFPPVRLEFEIWSGALEGNEEMITEMISRYEKTWGLAYQLRPFFSTIIVTWTALLGAVAIHFLREVPWNRALLISTIVSVISLILLGPLAVG
jgi:hypothetical protein